MAARPLSLSPISGAALPLDPVGESARMTEDRANRKGRGADVENISTFVNTKEKSNVVNIAPEKKDTMMNHFHLLDAACPHAYIFETVDISHPPTTLDANALGIEVTEPSIARMCGRGNIDPQHGPSSTPTSPAAIEACLDYSLPPRGTRLLTIRPDLDSTGGMAVLLLRSQGIEPSAEMRARVARIAEADRFSRGPWPGPRELPRTVDEIFEDGNGLDLTAMTLCISDRDLKLIEKVELVACWLATGKIPEIYVQCVFQPAERLLRSINNGTTVFGTHYDDTIASVASVEPGALRQAYRFAPVVVALNPAFRFPSGERGRKYTIARWAECDADLTVAAHHLAHSEDGWGGQPGIKGSPQSHPSRLDLTKVVDCLRRGLPNPSTNQFPEMRAHSPG